MDEAAHCRHWRLTRQGTSVCWRWNRYTTALPGYLANLLNFLLLTLNVFVACILSGRWRQVTVSAVFTATSFLPRVGQIADTVSTVPEPRWQNRGNGVGCFSSNAIMDEVDIRANFPSRPTSSPTMWRKAGLCVREDAVAVSGRWHWSTVGISMSTDWPIRAGPRLSDRDRWTLEPVTSGVLTARTGLVLVDRNCLVPVGLLSRRGLTSGTVRW